MSCVPGADVALLFYKANLGRLRCLGKGAPMVASVVRARCQEAT